MNGSSSSTKEMQLELSDKCFAVMFWSFFEWKAPLPRISLQTCLLYSYKKKNRLHQKLHFTYLDVFNQFDGTILS